MSLTSVIILSDDVTGAADCLSYTASLRLPASIVSAAGLPPVPKGILAVSSDSRHLSVSQSADAVRRTVRSFPAGEGIRWYKKIDSHLRGHAGTEIDVVLSEMSDDAIAIVSPALPFYRRGMKDGWILSPQLGGQRVHVPSLIAAETGREVGVVSLERVEAGEEEIRREVDAGRSRGLRIFVVDAVTEQHLRTLVRSVGCLAPVLFCGSAGLLKEVVSVLVPEGSPACAEGRLSATKRILGVVGSGTRLSHRQLDALRSARPVSILEFPARGEEKLFLPRKGHGAEDSLFVHLPPPPPDLRLDGSDARSVAARMIPFVLDLLPCFKPDVLLLSGGDTAELFLKALAVSSLQLERAVLPGMPLLAGRDGSGTLRGFVLKSGSHGDELALEDLLKRLQGGESA